MRKYCFEAEMSVPGPCDLYQIHRAVTQKMGGQPAAKGFAYAPYRFLTSGAVQVLLRTFEPENESGLEWCSRPLLNAGDRLQVLCTARLVKRSDSGEKLPDVSEAQSKLVQALRGFSVEELELPSSGVISFMHKTHRMIRLPYWHFRDVDITVTDPEQAVETMVRGVGRNRGLGFGMLITC